MQYLQIMIAKALTIKFQYIKTPNKSYLQKINWNRLENMKPKRTHFLFSPLQHI